LEAKTSTERMSTHQKLGSNKQLPVFIWNLYQSIVILHELNGVQESPDPWGFSQKPFTAQYLHIHLFILDISIAPPQVHYYSEALPTTALIPCRS